MFSLNGLLSNKPWALYFGELAFFHLERCLGAYPVGFDAAWTPPDYWDADDIALEMPEHPNVWTDGSREDFSSVGSFEVAGAGAYLPAAEVAFDRSVWGTVEEYGDARLERCRAFLPVPDVLQTVQRAEFWGAIVALQAYWPCHLGIDNLFVVRCIGRLLDAGCLSKPLPLVKDGDLVALVQYMIRTRGRDIVRVTKVKGHANDDDVQHGRVRLLDRQGNIEADTAADLGRRHQTELLIDARRRLLQARSYWYPIMTDLHRFMIAIARVSVTHNGKGGTAPDPLVWDEGSKPKVRRLAIRVTVDLASLPGPPGFLNSVWVQVDAGHISSADISAWPYSVGILVRFTTFLGTLHWPSGSVDLGHFGISFFGAFYPFRAMAGHRLLGEKVTGPRVRAGRPISVSSVAMCHNSWDKSGGSAPAVSHADACMQTVSVAPAVGSLPPCVVFSAPVCNQVHQELFAASEMTENISEIPVAVFEYVSSAPVIECVAPAPAVTFVVPSQQLPPVCTTTTVTTGDNSGMFSFVYPQFSTTAVEPFAPRVVDSLLPLEEFTEPVYDQFHQEQIAASEMTENIGEIPVVQEQVIVRTRPERLVDARWPQGRGAGACGMPAL